VASVATAKAGTRPGGSPAASDKGDPAAFSACMRRHGVENFPDPDSNGRIKITSGQSSTGQKTGVDTGSPQFAAAQQACHGLLPNGGKPSAAEQQKAIQQALKFAQCMRSHGVSKFPDPEVVDGGGIKQTVDGSLNPGVPQFRAAQQSCQKLVPGGPTSDGPPPGATP
jgi:hypothetical protein